MNDESMGDDLFRGERGPKGDHGQHGEAGEPGKAGKTGRTGETGKTGSKLFRIGMVLWIIIFSVFVIFVLRSIQTSRVQSCKRTYEGIRQVFTPFQPTDGQKQTPEQRANWKKFNRIIDGLKAQCGHQTQP